MVGDVIDTFRNTTSSAIIGRKRELHPTPEHGHNFYVKIFSRQGKVKTNQENFQDTFSYVTHFSALSASDEIRDTHGRIHGSVAHQ